MSGFKPMNAGQTRTEFEPRGPQPIPKSGARKARISLIVDLGVQQRDDFEEIKDGVTVTRPQKPCQQVAVYADLVNDVVDYGGVIGKQQYRLCLNKQFAGVMEGVNFAASPPKDAKGNLVPGKPWALHPQNLLTKLAKATGHLEIIPDEGQYGMDISRLLDEPFIADVEVAEKDSGKKDAKGEPIIYRNVNFKGASKVGTKESDDLDDDGNAIEIPDTVAALRNPALCITFDNATEEAVKVLRAGVIKMIKQAENYAGSNMQKAIEAYEAARGVPSTAASEAEDADNPATGAEAPAPKAKPAAKKTSTKPLPKAADEDDESPF
jgi:hypothetical protein